MNPPNHKTQRLPPRRVLLGGAYAITGITVLLLCLPLLLAQGLRYNLLQFGAGAVEIDNVDLNLFSGHLAVDGMRIYRSAAEVLSLGHAELTIDWHALFKRRLQLKQLSISQLAITLDKPDPGTLRIAGLLLPPPSPAPPEGTTPPSPWGIGIYALNIDHAQIQFIRPGLATSLTITQAKLGKTLSWEAIEPSHFTLTARFEQALLDINGDATPFANEPVANGTLKLDDFPLASLRPLLPAQYASLQGMLSSHLTLQFQQTPQRQRLSYEGQFSVGGLEMANRTLALRNRQLTWQGKGKLDLGPEQKQLTINGQLDSKALHLRTPNFEFENARFGWQGDTDVVSSGKKVSLNLKGKAEDAELMLKLPAQGLRLNNGTLSWQGTASLADINHPEMINSDSQLNLTALEGAPLAGKPIATLAAADIPAIHIDGSKNIAIGEVALAGLTADIRRTPQGVRILPTRNTMAEDKKPVKPAATAAQNPSPSMRLKIARITLARNSYIDFRDETVKPVFQQRLHISKATISSLDSAQVEQASPFELAVNQGKFGRLNASGSVQPFREELMLTLKSRLRDIEVPPLSPYLAKLLGYKANSGQLDSRLELKIERHAMKGVSHITLKQLELAPEDPARIENFEKKLNLPLNTALSLLRDSENNIQLKIPISGKLDDPKFDLTDAINTALGKAVRLAAVNYLKNLLQPYGTLISVVQLAGSMGGGIQLEPLHFEPGSTTPLATTQPYLERLGELLKSRKDLNLRLCGIATLSDLNIISKGKEKSIPAAGHPALEELARQRGENIKAILVDGYGIDAGRLFVCHPELDRSEKGEPRLEMQL